MIYWGFIAFFLLEYVRPAEFIPIPPHLNSLVPIAVAIAAILSKKGASNGDVSGERNTQLMMWFLALIVLSVLVSDVTTYAYTIFTVVVGYALIYWAIAKQVTTLGELKGLFRILVLVHVIVASLNTQIFTSGQREYLKGPPFMGDGNDFALSVNIALPMALFLFFDAKRIIAKIFYAAVMVVFVFSIVATQSRGGTIALMCVAAYYWSKSQNKIATLTIAVVLAVAALSFAPPGYFERMNDMTNTEEGSAAGRLAAWRAATEMAVKSPIVGIGAGHFGVMYGAIYKRPTQNAHSIYFLVLGELGFPGLTILLWFIIGNLVQNRRAAQGIQKAGGPTARTHAGMLGAMSAAIIAYATGGAFLSAIYYPHMYILAALAVGARRIVRQRAAEEVTAPPKPAITYHWALQPILGGSGQSLGAQRRRGGTTPLHPRRDTPRLR